MQQIHTESLRLEFKIPTSIADGEAELSFSDIKRTILDVGKNE